MELSRKAKESIKTALAMTITYGIALSMGWDKPIWAGLAVAFVSLATIGQSFNKAAMRLLGSILGGVAALVILSLFIQQRWFFMVALSGYVGFCSYMMCGRKNQYFWNVSGFVCVIMCMSAGPSSVGAFQIVVLRLQETGLGVFVYSLVALFLWPTYSLSEFTSARKKLNQSQKQLLHSLLLLVHGDFNQYQSVKKVLAQEHANFSLFLESAIHDNNSIRELEKEYRFYLDISEEITRNIECLYADIVNIKDRTVFGVLSDVDLFLKNIEERQDQINVMFEGQAPEKQITNIDLTNLALKITDCSHSQKAVFSLICSRLKKIDDLSSRMHDVVMSINGFKGDYRERVVPSPKKYPVIDLERLAIACRVIVSLWLAYLSVIYIESIPGGHIVIILTGSIGMAVASMPTVPISVLFKPITLAILPTSLVYFLLMPMLSQFWQLALVIFTFTFVICYRFYDPKQMIGRATGLSLFVTIMSISNEQSYSFISVTSIAMVFPIILFILAVSAYVPFSLHPEKVFVRLLHRFFKSCEFLIAQNSNQFEGSFKWLQNYQNYYHIKEVMTLPVKIVDWIPSIRQECSPEQINKLQESLLVISHRVQDLNTEQSNHQSQVLTNELQKEILQFHQQIQMVLQSLVDQPNSIDPESLGKLFEGLSSQIDKRIETILDSDDSTSISEQDGVNYYRLIGAYYGLSKALVEYGTEAGQVNWQKLNEEYF